LRARRTKWGTRARNARPYDTGVAANAFSRTVSNYTGLRKNLTANLTAEKIKINKRK
jgi:hypothetical protein